MALDFPLNPSNGTVYNGPNGISYVYDFTNGYWIVQSESVSITDGAVTTSKIANGAVTGVKIADDAVTPANLDRTYVEPPSGGSVVGYQQGIWTPTVNAGTIYVYNTTWERIGDQVTIRAQINGFTTLSDTPIYVQGKPYLTRENVEALGPAMATRFNNGCTACLASLQNVNFYRTSPGDNNTWVEQKYSDRWNDAYSGIWFQVTYRTDDTTWTPINGATVS